MRTIKITIGKLISIAGIMASHAEINLPVKASFYVAKNIDILERENKDYEKARVKLVEQYGKKDEAGNLVKDDTGNVAFDKADREKYYKNIEELQEMETTVEFKTFDYSLIENREDIPPSYMTALSYMLENTPE